MKVAVRFEMMGASPAEKYTWPPVLQTQSSISDCASQSTHASKMKHRSRALGIAVQIPTTGFEAIWFLVLHLPSAVGM